MTDHGDIVRVPVCRECGKTHVLRRIARGDMMGTTWADGDDGHPLRNESWELVAGRLGDALDVLGAELKSQTIMREHADSEADTAREQRHTAEAEVARLREALAYYEEPSE